MVLGYANLANNYFIKVQDQGGGGKFNYYAFYYGNNGVGPFVLLTTPFAQGTITATLSGTAVTLNVLPTGGSLQTYSYNYGIASGGTGIGLGFWGTALAGNFTDAVPEPTTFMLIACGLSAIASIRRKRTCSRVS